MIADTFLSVNLPAQSGLPSWMTGRGEIEWQILARVRANLQVLSGYSVLRVLPVQAGWSAILDVPQLLGSDDLAVRLVTGPGLIVYPGSFFGMRAGNRMVISLLGEPAEFHEGIQRLGHWCESKELPVESRGKAEPA